MNRLLLARVLAISGAMLSMLVIVIGGALQPRYSHSRQFISELGASGTAYGELVSFGGFLPLGILLAVLVVVAAPLANVKGASRVGFWLFLGSQAVAYSSAAFAPCDIGCPAEGSVSQDMHNLFGLLTYLAAGAGLFLLSSARRPKARVMMIALGIAWLAIFFAMVDPAFASWRGALQRVAEIILWGTVLFIAWKMLLPERLRKNAMPEV